MTIPLVAHFCELTKDNGSLSLHCFTEGKLPELPDKKKEIIRKHFPSNICSFKKSKKCNEKILTGNFYQIELHDHRTYLVENLHLLQMQYFANNSQCFGRGKRTGTSAFCTMHNFSNEETQFCSYPNNKIVYYVDSESKILIKAGGITEAQYYEYKRINEKQGCSRCKANRIQSGIQFYSNEPVLVFEFCAEPFCLIKKTT